MVPDQLRGSQPVLSRVTGATRRGWRRANQLAVVKKVAKAVRRKVRARIRRKVRARIRRKVRPRKQKHLGLGRILTSRGLLSTRFRRLMSPRSGHPIRPLFLWETCRSFLIGRATFTYLYFTHGGRSQTKVGITLPLET